MTIPRPRSCRTIVPVVRPTVTTTVSVESAEAMMIIFYTAERHSSPAAAGFAAAARCSAWFGVPLLGRSAILPERVLQPQPYALVRRLRPALLDHRHRGRVD